MRYVTRIDKLGNKHYQIVINLGFNPTTGRYQRKKQTVHGTKAEAELVLQQMLADLSAPPKRTFSDEPLGEFMLRWVNQIIKPDLEQNTYENYLFWIERHINPSLGHIPLCELTPDHIQTFISYKSEQGRIDGQGGLSNRSVEYIYRILDMALKKALALELIEKNPASGISPPKRKQSKEGMVVLSKRELDALLEAAKGHRDYALFYCAAYTGMRQSELLGLKWDNVWWKQKQINVEMGLHRLDSGEYEHRPRTKNRSSTRIIGISDSVVTVLQTHQKEQMELKNNSSFKNKLNLVFTDSEGGPLDRRNLSKRFSSLAAKHGHQGMTFHDLRHTHATILLSEGVIANAVSERLGHSDIQTTLGIYGHVLPAVRESLADLFEDL